MRVRTPAVAGMFYPKEKNGLKTTINDCFLHSFGPGKLPPSESVKKIYGVICPHAGYAYSGPIATHSYYAISSEKFEVVIIIGPNHWGVGCNVATMKEGEWQTPLGNVEVDSELCKELNKISKIIELDFFSHTREHSIEVQVPMLQEIFPHRFKIIPIILISQDYTTAKEVGSAVAKIAKIKKSIIIGSSDLTHYEENNFAHKQDKSLIEPILRLDLDSFYQILKENQISACGYGAIASTHLATLGLRECVGARRSARRGVVRVGEKIT